MNTFSVKIYKLVFNFKPLWIFVLGLSSKIEVYFTDFDV